jgi:hypothetical protein
VVQLNRTVGAGFWHAFEYDSLPAFMTANGLTPFAPSAP